MIYSFCLVFRSPPFQKMDFVVNKLIKCDLFIFLCGFHSKGYPRSKKWTLDFEPAFSPRFFTHLEPTFLFSHWSAVSHPKTRHFRFPWARNPIFPTGQRFPPPEVPLVTWSLSTNQEPGNRPYEPNLLLIRISASVSFFLLLQVYWSGNCQCLVAVVLPVYKLCIIYNLRLSSFGLS